MSIQLPDLPYAQDALEPYISARTLQFHHGKHHRGYVDKLNAAIEDSDYADKSLEQIIVAAYQREDEGIFNNAAQVWNHSFLWHSMRPGGGGTVTGALGELVERSFGSHDAFATEFRRAATGQFGSGWTWLVLDGDQLQIMPTPNALNPVLLGLKPLLTLDVWEHAYYLDYQNDRGGYVDTFLAHLLNWDFAAANCEATAAAA